MYEIGGKTFKTEADVVKHLAEVCGESAKANENAKRWWDRLSKQFRNPKETMGQMIERDPKLIPLVESTVTASDAAEAANEKASKAQEDALKYGDIFKLTM